MKYYAEHDLDRIIRQRYFPDFTYKGTIVEVGGATPEFISNSRHFKDNGWRTIVVEPNPTFAEMHKLAGNEIFQYACSNENLDDVDFTVVSVNVGAITDHSFSSISVKPEYIAATGYNNLNHINQTKIKVSIRTLDYILNSINVSKVDLLSVDTEGWELEVMQGLDTKKIDCNVIVLENMLHQQSYTDYMNSIGFKLEDIIGNLNYIYIKK